MGNTLGLAKICPEENIGSISRQTLYTYLAAFHKPERMVVAGVGVDHDELVEATVKHFVEKPPVWASGNVPKVVTDRSVAQYTGGLEVLEKDLRPFCVLNMMMGGGGSFSAGGPGKGMYTRLYTRVLNRYHWMYSATAYNHAYNDSGIFCIHASAHPQSLVELTQVLVRELVAITGRISEEELNRAKT